MTVRVLIADDHPVVRAGVTALLDTIPTLRLLRPQPPLPRLLLLQLPLTSISSCWICSSVATPTRLLGLM